jgi:hypothetical protein
MRRAIVLGVIFGIMAAAARAQDSDAEASENRADSLELQLSGNHLLDLRLPADGWSYGSAVEPGSSRNVVAVRAKAGELQLVSEWRASVLPGADGGRAEASLEAEENALYWKSDRFGLGIGWQYFSWGVADRQNPTDNVNARDYSVGLDAEKFPALALSASWYPIEGISIQAVYKPVAEASVFPVDPVAATQSTLDDFLAGFNSTFGSSVKGSVASSDPLESPESFVAGGRIALASRAVDLSASYLYDWDRYYTPSIALNSNALGYYYPSSVTLDKKRVHRFGLDAKTTIGAMGLWLETAFNLPQGYAGKTCAARNPSLGWTAGMDISFGPGETLYANIQYLGEYVLDYDYSFYSYYPGGKPAPSRMRDSAYMETYFERATVQRLGGQYEGLLQGLALNLKFPFAEDRVVPSITAICLMPFLYDDSVVTRYGSLGLKPEIDFAPKDSLHIKLGAELCYAWVRPAGGGLELVRSGDRLGGYTVFNNVYLTAEYSWDARTAK